MSVARVRLLLGKDLRVLRRSPLLLGLLLAYPLLIAALVVLVAQYANAKPRVALVDEDGLPRTVEIGGRTFHPERTIDRASREVELVRLDRDEAHRQLDTGRVVAVVTIPAGFVSELRAMVRSPELRLETTRGGLAPRVTQQVQALVYQLNRELQDAYIDANLEYVRLILDGGNGDFAGQRFDVLGLRETERLLDELPRGPRLDRIRSFVQTARLALGETGSALRATAHPIELVQADERGRTWALSAQVQAYALALVTTLLGLLLAAGSLAAERDENVAGRLARGLVSLGQLVAAKAALAAVVSLALGTAIALAFGLAIELGGVEGGEPWARLPLLAAAVALVGACVGALGALVGALAREARSASLVAVLVVLPVVFLGLVPREVAPAAGWLSDLLPFAHAVRLFAAALYDLDPWRTVLVESAWLAAIGLVFAVAARAAARRLVA
ncbi:MAG: ABC transporter permease [Pseudomonadota bacterium]